MPAEFPYLTTVKNTPAMLEKIKAAGAPPKFTYEFLKTNLGFGSSTDRPIINILRKLGFLTTDGTPTARYNEFRDPAKSGKAMAAGLREGWSEIFLSNQQAHTLTATDLAGIFKTVTGKGESVAVKMAATFKALASAADWKAGPDPAAETPAIQQPATPEPPAPKTDLNLHHDIHVHLPATSDVAVYTAIFRALREELL